MTASSAAAALARGTLVVTPNKRLARELVARHDAAQRDAGFVAWPAARALPWNAFVADLWQQALDAGLDLPPHRLDDGQSTHLWQRIVATDLASNPLLDAAAAARLAAEAWERVQGYGEGGASWRGFAAGGPEVEAFARWAGAFERETRRLGALDLARAPDALARIAASLPGVGSLEAVLAGFVEVAPQQRRLLDALRAAGARVDRIDGDDSADVRRGRLVGAATPRDELLAALAWARRKAEADPQARVGIVVHDLHERRALVAALAEDVLCPGLQWPGDERAPRPYDISAGGALADAPVIATALHLVALAHGPLDRMHAAALMHSRYLPGDEAQRAARSGVERDWLEHGRRELTLPAIAAALGRADPSLASRWRAVRPTVPSRGAPRAYVEAWRQWLEATGWCDGVALDAAELAARGAWAELLAAFVRLTAVAPRMTRDEALLALRAAAQARAFEPEAPGARVRILGVLEAGGLAFDAVWVAGLAAEAWPRAPEPTPLLPIAWQRERDIPRATAARELEYARALTAALDASAAEVVFSYARTLDDHASHPSPLIAHLPPLVAEVPRPLTPARAQFDARPALERVADERAPAWADGVAFRGGAGLVDAQSTCPFRAGGRYRLRAEGWPEALAGLGPAERGRFVHAALAAFWSAVRDHATLAGLDDAALDRHIAAAVGAGRAAVDDALWNALPPVVAAGEGGHVARLMRAWLALDRERPPFTVERTEMNATLALAGHELALRIDRVDRLADGRRIVIDYKTGMAVAPEHWFAERPQAPQLALYAMALDADAPLAGLAYAQLKPGQVRAVGLAADATAWPALSEPGAGRRIPVADWTAAQATLRQSIEALGQAVRDGDVRIAPRDAKACSVCDLQPLCRVAILDEGDEAEENGDE
ncbi:MAG TPA: PD-(D/E)XK nuclease family protein [Casimicrobiaceae bacterium]|nr:PD-(D/E)XK nuclease family protein [Casimicrobiaceae bacterium]